MTQSKPLNDVGILVVDEQVDNQIRYRECLEGQGARVFFAQSGEEALTFMLTKVQEENVSVVISQEQLGQMRAKDLLAVSQITTSLKKIRFIVVFSSESDNNVNIARTQGFEGYIVLSGEDSAIVNTVEQSLQYDDEDMEYEDRSIEYEETNKSLSSLKILLVEDNAINQKVALKTLYKRGYRCDTAWNGEEALTAVRENNYDVILMDCQMPVMDGYEAARQIRAYENGERYVRIIALTAYAMEGDREKCFDAGMDLYLTKPIDFDKVQEVLIAIEGVEKQIIPEEKSKIDSKVILGTIGDYREHFIEKTGFDKNEVEQLFTEFEELLRTQVKNLTKALENQDYEEIKELAHQIKGASGNLMIEPMQLETKDLEKNVAEKNWVGCRDSISRLSAYIERG